MPTILITGANRGIGLEFAHQYAHAGWNVHAACRKPDAATALHALPGVTVHKLDVSDRKSIDALAAELDIPLDVVIANAGVMGGDIARQNFGNLDYATWEDVMTVNLYGAVRTAEAFTPHLERGGQKKLAVISSQMGSITDTSAGFTMYRTSKAALNMAMTAAATGLRQKDIAVGIFHPGWVKTDMGGPGAKLTVHESVEGLRQQIDAIEPTDQPAFLNYAGDVLPW